MRFRAGIFHLPIWVFLVFLGRGTAAAEGTVEGRVDLLPASIARQAHSRYQLKNGVVAKPAPPVAVVYLEGDFGDLPSGQSNQVVELGQRNFQFEKRVVPVRKGSTVLFPNYDDDYHNVLSYSKAKEFDLGRYLKSESPPAVTFEKEGIVELDCEIHSHMRATILVVDTPYFTTTDPEGRYKLEGIPPGTHRLKVFINYKTRLEQPVEVAEGQVVRVDFKNP